MRLRRHSTFYALFLLLAGTASAATGGKAAASKAIPAFPGAQGGGAASVGGRGGQVCEVTTLSDSGPGSARDCLTRKGPRTVVFRVAGRINLLSGIRVTEPFMTIAGQSAPGGGIEFAGKQMNNDSLIFIYAHDVIVRYLRVRIGNGPGHRPGPGTGCVGIFIGNADVYNVILDHISVSWSDNKPIGVWANYGPGVRNVTVQWSMINESIKGHGVGPGIGNSNGATAGFTDDDFHHNFLSNATHRLPETSSASMRWVNNIVYNWSFYATATLGYQQSDFIGNIYKAGPLNPEAQKHELHFASVSNGWDDGPPSVYLLGNKGPNQQNANGDQWAMASRIKGENLDEIGPVPPTWRRSSPLPAETFPIVADDVNALESALFPGVGDSQRLDCDGNWVSKRDVVDSRLINEYRTGTGSVPVSEDAVGGFPAIDPGTACPESGHDGMPDTWKAAHNLAKTRPDGGKVTPDGYTNLEHYLNGIPAPHH
jgi:pectate lyase